MPGPALLTAYYYVPTGNDWLLHAKETSAEGIESIWATEAQGNLHLPLTGRDDCGNYQAPSPEKRRYLQSPSLSLTLPEEGMKEYTEKLTRPDQESKVIRCAQLPQDLLGGSERSNSQTSEKGQSCSPAPDPPSAPGKQSQGMNREGCFWATASEY